MKKRNDGTDVTAIMTRGGVTYVGPAGTDHVRHTDLEVPEYIYANPRELYKSLVASGVPKHDAQEITQAQHKLNKISAGVFDERYLR